MAFDCREAAFEDDVFLVEADFVFGFALEPVEGFRETDDLRLAMVFERLGCLAAAFFETRDAFLDALLAVRLPLFEADLAVLPLVALALVFLDEDFADEGLFDFELDFDNDLGADFDFDRGEILDLVALLALLVLAEFFDLLEAIAFEDVLAAGDLAADDFEQDPPARLIRPHVRVVISFCFR